jgi:hypothetical protein
METNMSENTVTIEKGKLRALDPLLDPYPEDTLNIKNSFVEPLYHLIESIEPPFAISIDGLWGSGKTTVMKMLQRRLEAVYRVTEKSLQSLQKIKEQNETLYERLLKLKDQDYKNQEEFVKALNTVMEEDEITDYQETILEFCQIKELPYPTFWFNPWEYQDAESVVMAFLQRFATEELKTLDKAMRTSLKILGTVGLLGLDVALGVVPRAIGAFLEKIKDPQKIKEIGELFEKNYEKYQDIIQMIRDDFTQLINNVSKKHDGKPVIIFFDDLDRCLPDKTIQLLEAVKNLFVVKDTKVIFICGIDTHIAKQFIKAHYKDIEESFAINYFRKIFNLTISMPSSPDLYKLLLKYVQELHNWDSSKTEALAKMIYTRGLQAKMVSVRSYLNIVHNFYTFQKFNPGYEFQPENDLVVHLLVVKEAWQPFYEDLMKEAAKNRTEPLSEMVKNLLTNYKNNNKLSSEQETFLQGYFVESNSPFGNVKLADELFKYPTLA